MKVSAADEQVGLFGQLSRAGRLSNLHVSGDVENTSPTVYYAAGGIWLNYLAITNCSFSGSVRGAGKAGGMYVHAMEKLFFVRTQHPFPVKKQVVLPGRNLLQFPN